MAGDDAGNNLVEEPDARCHKTTYAVDGDTSRNEEVTDRLGNKTAYEYDDSGRTTKVTSKIYEVETEENKNPITTQNLRRSKQRKGQSQIKKNLRLP